MSQDNGQEVSGLPPAPAQCAWVPVQTGTRPPYGRGYLHAASGIVTYPSPFWHRLTNVLMAGPIDPAFASEGEGVYGDARVTAREFCPATVRMDDAASHPVALAER
jgi:hypothetical protein